jgi:hypothetical protein
LRRDYHVKQLNVIVLTITAIVTAILGILGLFRPPSLPSVATQPPITELRTLPQGSAPAGSTAQPNEAGKAGSHVETGRPPSPMETREAYAPPAAERRSGTTASGATAAPTPETKIAAVPKAATPPASRPADGELSSPVMHEPRPPAIRPITVFEGEQFVLCGNAEYILSLWSPMPNSTIAASIRRRGEPAIELVRGQAKAVIDDCDVTFVGTRPGVKPLADLLERRKTN